MWTSARECERVLAQRAAARGNTTLIAIFSSLALEWSLALSEFCKMPEALHPTHGSQVGGGLVNLESFVMKSVQFALVRNKNSLGGRA